MFQLLLAAEPNVWAVAAIDVALVLVLIVFLILGIKKGIMKMGWALIALVASVALAVFTAAPITNAICANTEWDDQLGNKLETSVLKSLPNPNANIFYYDDDSDPETEAALGYEAVIDENATEIRPFSELFDKAGIFSLLRNGLDPYVRASLDAAQAEADANEDDRLVSVTFIDQAELYLAKMIILGVGFVALLIIYRIILAILGHFIDKAVRSLYLANFVNRLLGAIFGLACGAVLIFVIITVLQLLSPLPFMTDVNAYLAQTKIVSFIMEKNVVYNMLANIINQWALK